MHHADMSIETSTVRVGDLSAYLARPAGGSGFGMLLLPMITGIGAQVRAWADELAERSALVGLTPVTGPSVTVTLTDAPSSVAGDGVDQDLLVVHQQDIQAVANELWRGGAEAMTIQGQRVIATTGIKCVGNTVVLHGIPYAPPYRISAIGDPAKLQAALAGSEFIRIYQQYVDAYRLGYEVTVSSKSDLPGYQGSVDLQYATVSR